MVRNFPSLFARAVLLFSAFAFFTGTGDVLSAPLLHSFETTIRPAGRVKSMATDCTNVVAAVYTPSSRMVGAMFLSTNETPLERYNIRQSGSPPYVAFNGTNYLLAWTESPGDAAELRGQFINSSFNLIGSQFILMAGLSAQNLTGLSWDGRTFLAVWGGISNSLSFFQGQLFFPDGGAVGPILQISSPGANATNCATTAATNHFIVWMESNGPTNEWHTRSRLVSADASLSEILTLSSTPAASANPVAASFGATNFMAIWNREVGPFRSQACWQAPCPWTTNYWLMLFGRVVGPDGSFRGDEFQISNMRGNQINPQAAFDGTNFLVTWTDSRLTISSFDPRSSLITMGQRVSATGTMVDTDFYTSSRGTSADALIFAENRFVYALHYSYYEYGRFEPTEFEYLTFVAPRRSGSLRNFVANSDGYSHVEFVQSDGLWGFRLELSTNLVEWRMIQLDDWPTGFFLSLRPNQITKWAEPLPNYSGPRFYRANYPTDACLSNLVMLDHFKAAWAFERDKSLRDEPSDTDLFGPGKYLPRKPQCPGGGSYMLDNTANRVACSLASQGHTL